jgi:hypothetical protein
MTIEKMQALANEYKVISWPNCLKATFKDGKFIVGFFVDFDDAIELEKRKQYRFVKNPDSQAYHKDPRDKSNSVIIDLNDLSTLELISMLTPAN